MRRLIAIGVTAALLGGPVAAGRASVLPGAAARCSGGSLSHAATEVFGTGTEVVERRSIAGLEGALVLEPLIAPGTRGLLLRVDDSWCEASSAFNLAWSAAGRSFDGDAAARAYTRIAATPYFDRTSVRSVEEKAPGTHVILTHALTNGVDARWVVTVDELGIRSATWTATAFAQQPFRAETEGLTALPGGTETYTRTAQALLIAARGLPDATTAASDEPGIAEYVSPDDFHVAVSIGDTRVALDPGTDTGVRKADIVRETLEAIKVNYEDFHSWGLRKGWGELEPVSGPDKGYVYLNDALSLYCFACVFIADDFQIHMLSEVEVILGALGYSYPDSVKAWQDIIGHEMFHNFQNRYVKPGPLGRSAGRSVPTAYSEGTARAQEALHDYSDVSYQDQSLIYATDANGCNGFDRTSMDAAMASGLFNKGYSGCFYWLSWFAAEGTDGLVRLLSKAYPKVADQEDPYVEGIMALELASSMSPAEQAARFAGAAITGRGYRIGGRDWAKMLDRWAPPPIAIGEEASAGLLPSGLLARAVKTPMTVSLGKGADAQLFTVVEDGSRVATRVIGGGSVCLRPKAGEKVWVGAVRTKGEGLASFTAAGPCR
jgi:hypothetical protein